MIWRPLVLVTSALVVLTPARLSGQDADQPAPLELFVQRVALLWSAGEVAALVAMIPEDNRFMLDTGAGAETATTRHAAAALRALFAESETIGATPVRVTVASAEPARGFGEIHWTFRPRGAPGEQSRSVYVGARWEGSDWCITELRIMP